MTRPPPLPNLPPKLNDLPPILPPALPDCGIYLNYCANICFAVAGLLCLGCIGVGIERAQQGGEGLAQLIFVAGVMVFAAASGVLLHQRRKLGHPLAMILFAMMMLGIPLGTVFGILGIKWLNKGQHLLR